MIYFKIAKKFTSSNFVTAKLKNRKFKEANISVAESGYNCLYSKKKFVFQLLIFSCSIFKLQEVRDQSFIFIFFMWRSSK